MISVVIMVIVLIILVSVVMSMSTRPIQEASEMKFLEELSEVKKGINVKRLANSKKGTSEEVLNSGFIKVYVDNAPETFKSFDANAVTGYVVDLSVIEYEKLSNGHGYLDFVKGDTVDFNVHDVYLYDAVGDVYYAKGYVLEDGSSYYSDDSGERINGPKIEVVSTAQGNVEVDVTPTNNGTISSVVIGGMLATNTGGSRYTATVTSNGNYVVIADENGGSQTRITITVSDIEADVLTAPVITNVYIADNKQYTKETSEVVYIEATDAAYVYISVNSSAEPSVADSSAWRRFVENATVRLTEGNNQIYVWCKDEHNNISTSAMVEIIVDLTPPNNTAPTYVLDGYKATVTSSQTDRNTITVTYGYKKENEISYVWQESNVLENLEPRQKYNIVTKAVDVAGNETISRPVTTTEVAAIPGGVTIEVTPEGYSAEKNVKITYPSAANNSPYFCVYRINGGTWQESPALTHTIKVISNTKVEAAVAGKLNGVDTEYGAIEYVNISTIDRVGPDISEIRTEKVDGEDGVHLFATIVDAQSGLTAWEFTKTDEEPVTWSNTFTAITTEVEATHYVEENGTYYLWTRDSLGYTSKSSVDVIAIDTTNPIFKESTISYGSGKATWNVIAQDENLGLNGYAILEGEGTVPTDADWVDIPTTQTEYTISHEVTKNGFYTIWLRDVSGKTSYQVKEIKVIFKVTYDYATNGGQSVNLKPNVIEKGCNTLVDLSPVAEKKGYTFIGWNTNPNATEGLTSFTVGTVEDVKLYAIYSLKVQVSLVYYEGIQQKTGTIIKEAFNTAEYAEIEIPKVNSYLTGWNTKGWSTEASSNAEVEYSGDNITLTLSGDMTLYMLYGKNISSTYRYYGYDELTENSNDSKYLYVEKVNESSYKGYYPTSNVLTSEITTNASNISATTASRVTIPEVPTTVKNQNNTTWNLRGWNDVVDLSKESDYKTGDTVAIKDNKVFYASYDATISANKYIYGETTPIVATGKAKMSYNGSTVPAEINLGTSDDVGYKNAAWSLIGWNTKSTVTSNVENTINSTVSIDKDTNFYGIYSKDIQINIYTYPHMLSKLNEPSYLNIQGETIKAEFILPSQNDIEIENRIWLPRGYSSTALADATIEKHIGDKIQSDENLELHVSYYRGLKANVNSINNKQVISTSAYLSEDGDLIKATVNPGTIANATFDGYTWQGEYWSKDSEATAPIFVGMNTEIEILDDIDLYSVYRRDIKITENKYGGATNVLNGVAKLNASGKTKPAEITLSAAESATVDGKVWDMNGWNTHTSTKTPSAVILAPSTLITSFEDKNYYAMYGGIADVVIHNLDENANAISTTSTVGTIMTYAGVKESSEKMILPTLAKVTKDGLTWEPMGYVSSAAGYTESNITTTVTNAQGDELVPEAGTNYYAMYKTNASLQRVERNVQTTETFPLYMNSKANVEGAKVILGAIDSVTDFNKTWYGNGWSKTTDKASSPEYTVSDEITLTKNEIYYASYERDVKLELHEYNTLGKPNVRLTESKAYLDTLGNKVASTVNVAAPINTTVTAEEVSWTFAGWAGDLSVADSSIANGSNTTVQLDDNLALYAKYTRPVVLTEKVYNNTTLANKPGVAILNANGEIGEASITLDPIEKVTLNNEDWNGRGWSTNTEATAGENFTLVGGVVKLYKDATYYASYNKDITLQAISYLDDERTVKTRNASLYMNYVGAVEDATIIIPKAEQYYDWTSDGYTLATNNDVAEADKIKDFIVTRENKTVYALYNRTIGITFDTQGGEPQVDKVEGVQKVNSYNIATTLNPELLIPTANLILNGKEFTNTWTKVANDLTSDSTTGGENYAISENTTLYAYYQPSVYTITYDLNGGTGTVDSQTKKQGENLYITDQVPQKGGLPFLGWGVSKDSSSVLYEPGDLFFWNGDVTLYAVYGVGVLAEKDTWYKGKTDPSTITNIIITNAYTETGNEVETWHADSENRGLIDCYINGTTLYISNTQTRYGVREEIELSEDMSGMFAKFTNVTSITGLKQLDLSNTKSINNLFGNNSGGCSKLLNLNGIQSWDVSKVITASNAFSTLTVSEIDISNWKLEQLKDYSYMFNNCGAKTIILGNSEINIANGMFSNSNNVELIDLSNVDITNITSAINMFANCENLTTIFVATNFSQDKLSGSTGMFKGCINIVGGNGTSYNPLITDKTYAYIDSDAQSGYLTQRLSGAGDITARLYDAGTTSGTYVELTPEGAPATPWDYTKGERILEIKARNLATDKENIIKVTVPTGMYIKADSWSSDNSNTAIVGTSFETLANQGTGNYKNSQTGTLTVRVKATSTYAKIQMLVMYDTTLWNKQANNGNLTIEPPITVTLDDTITKKISSATASVNMGTSLYLYTYPVSSAVYDDDVEREVLNTLGLLYSTQINPYHYYKDITYTTSMYSTDANGQKIYATHTGTTDVNNGATFTETRGTEETTFHSENAYLTSKSFPRPRYTLESTKGFVVNKTVTLDIKMDLVDFVGNIYQISKQDIFTVKSKELNYNNISMYGASKTVANANMYTNDNMYEQLGTLALSYNSVTPAPNVTTVVEFDKNTAENQEPKLKVVTYRLPITKGTSANAKVTLVDDAGKFYVIEDYAITGTEANNNGVYIYSQNIAKSEGLVGTFYLKKIEYIVANIVEGYYYNNQGGSGLTSGGVFIGLATGNATSTITMISPDGKVTRTGTSNTYVTNSPTDSAYISYITPSKSMLTAGEDVTLNMALDMHSYPYGNTQRMTEPNVYISLPFGVSIKDAIYSTTSNGAKITDSTVTLFKTYTENNVTYNIYKISPTTEIVYGAVIPYETYNGYSLTKYLKLTLSTDTEMETTTIGLKNAIGIMNGTNNTSLSGAMASYKKLDIYDFDGDGSTSDYVGTISSDLTNIVIKGTEE